MLSCSRSKQDREIGEKYSCNGVSKKDNNLYFELYNEVIDIFDKTAIASELKGVVLRKPRV